MATRYAVGTGVWDDVTSWSDTSGGTTGFSVPVDGDHVKFDSNSGTITLDRDERCDTIVFQGGGVLDTDSTGNHQMTVDEQVNFSSGGVMNCNTSDIYIGSTVLSSVYTLTCTNGTFNGGDGEHWIGCVKCNSGGNCNLTSGITHINGEETSSSAGVLLGTGDASTKLVHNGGTVSFETDRSTQIILQYVDITLNNVIVDLGGTTQRLSQWANGSITTLTIAGDFTVTKGIFDTKYASVQECTIDVTGTTTIGDASATGVDYATLTTNESAIDLQGTNGSAPGLEMLAGGTFNGVSNANHTIGSVEAKTTTYNSKIYLTSGTTTIYQEMGSNMTWQTYSNADVNIYHGNGTVKFTAPTYAYLYNNAVAGGDNSFYNVIIDHAGAAGQRIALSGDVIFSVINDLTVSDGDFYTGGAGNTYVGNDCLVDNGDTHVFNTSGANNRPITVLGELTVREDSTYLAGDESNTFGALTLSGNSTFNASTGVTMLSGNVGSTNEAGYTWTPFYQRGSATFNHNNGTFHNKSAKGYVAYQQYGSRVGPFYNYIQDFVAESAHTFNTDIIIEGDATMSGTCSLNGGVWGLRNENQYDFFVSGNLILLSGSGVGGGLYQNTATPKMITEGNIIMHPDSKLTTATGSLGPGWEIGGNLINNGGYIY